MWKWNVAQSCEILIETSAGFEPGMGSMEGAVLLFCLDTSSFFPIQIFYKLPHFLNLDCLLALCSLLYQIKSNSPFIYIK